MEPCHPALLQRPSARQRPLRTVGGLTGSSKAYFLARLFCAQRVPLLIITPDGPQRDTLAADLHSLLSALPEAPPHWPGFRHVVCHYTHEALPDADTRSGYQHRALTWYQPLWRLLGPDPVVVVTTVESLRALVVPPAHLQSCLISLQTGAVCALADLTRLLVEYGYRRVGMVDTPGEFAVRGGLLDVFSPGYLQPIRLEFFGDEIESLRAFDVQAQTSTATFSQVMLAPMFPVSRQHVQQDNGLARLLAHCLASHCPEATVQAQIARWREQLPSAWPWGVEAFLYETPVSPLAYLPANGLLCVVDAEETALRLAALPPPAPLIIGDLSVPRPETHLMAAPLLTQAIQERLDVALLRYETPSTPGPVPHGRPLGVPQFFGGVERCITQLQQWQAAELCVVLLCHSALEARRMQELLTSYHLTSHTLATCTACVTTEALRPGALYVVVGELSQGFVWPEMGLVLLRHADMFGEKKQEASPTARRRTQVVGDFATLRPGESVVHVDYGVGRYRGMTFLDGAHHGGEFMELEYAEGAKLYVPSYRLSLVHKHTGSDSETVALDRLGGHVWARTKERVQAALFAMAEDLVQIHAARQLHPGYSFSPDATMHREFANGFDYVETDDQLRAIQDVLADMERDRPMERLVCGDVGYGKTEVAMRAAFKAAYDSKQVAVLVPTTVLAQQHYETFQRRFAPYPLQIGLLSRLSSRKEQQKVLTGLQQGSVDIVIGTHRLLQTDISFKDLGLLVVDEEHRFGVAHKEKIKRLSAQVDVLMLTATPIPRSLHMALVGLRDCSMIATPPEGRHAIETMVTPYNDTTITEAIRAELARHGQVFFVHNRIDTLPAMQALLQRLVPECRVGIAHGQMAAGKLDTVMMQFLDQRFDVLLCTTIIESGLDIPNANTILIHHAETLGLAQLYQLRGRVGRSAQQAYAYLLIPGDLLLSDTARKRIEALEEFCELGAGIHLASRDLEIRGAGNLLGAQQSGHIASVGFDLYCQMLEEAIRRRRGEQVLPRVDPELRLEVQGYLPEDYVESAAQRLDIYRRCAVLTEPAALETLRRELHDRFGTPPPAVARLLSVIELKLLARALLLERVEQRGLEVLLTFHPQTPVEPTRLLQWLQASAPRFQFHSERVVRLPLPRTTADARLGLLKNRLHQLHTDGSM